MIAENLDRRIDPEIPHSAASPVLGPQPVASRDLWRVRPFQRQNS